MGRLDGRTALITGGSSGMALTTAKLFVAEGAFVFVTGRDQAKLDAAVDEIGTNAMGVLADAADLDDIDTLMQTVRSARGHLDVLFTSAGAWSRRPRSPSNDGPSHAPVNHRSAFSTDPRPRPQPTQHARAAGGADPSASG